VKNKKRGENAESVVSTRKGGLGWGQRMDGEGAEGKNPSRLKFCLIPSKDDRVCKEA
jgi:hypothetical protein